MVRVLLVGMKFADTNVRVSQRITVTREFQRSKCLPGYDSLLCSVVKVSEDTDITFLTSPGILHSHFQKIVHNCDGNVPKMYA